MTMLEDLLAASSRGEPAATSELYAALYHELHQLAAYHLRRPGPETTLGTTTLLHEAFLALAEREQARFADRKRFLAYASKTMRALVIDHGRARRATKRGGDVVTTRLDSNDPPDAAPAEDDALDRLSQSLDDLATVDPELAQLVDLHFFCGYSFVELAKLLDVSERTIQRDWRKARILLQRMAAG